MKKTSKGIAASLLMAVAILASVSMTNKPMDSQPPLSDYNPVVVANNNTLAKTPPEIQNLVKGLNIDIRNSAFLILQQVKDIKDYQWGESTDDGIALFVHYSIVAPTNDDPAVYNLSVDDRNNCIAAYGDNDNCWEMTYYGGPTWKSRVVDKILSSENLQNVLYKWLKPELVRLVGSLDNVQKLYMKSVVNHMIDYTAAYNHNSEQAFYLACLENDNTDAFTSIYVKDRNTMEQDWDHVANPYRRLETWVYRRVEDGTMTAAQINTWLKKLKTDLQL